MKSVSDRVRNLLNKTMAEYLMSRQSYSLSVLEFNFSAVDVWEPKNVTERQRVDYLAEKLKATQATLQWVNKIIESKLQ